jgi:predicted nucleotidyltransferase
MNIENLLKSLNEFDVKYVIIGATAFPVHGYVRATLDVDIFIEPTHENAEKTLNALVDFGYDVTEITIDDLLTKKILIRQYAVETDIHPFVKGVIFNEVWNTRKEGVYGKTKTYFASLSSLIKMKKAAGRVKDLEDLKYLERL